MNSFITDYDFYQCGMNLDTRRHGAMVYENIHMLASNLGVNDRLVNPKRDVSNHPACKLWKGYEEQHLFYINSLLVSWIHKGYKSTVNKQNYKMLYKVCNPFGENLFKTPPWITDELIETHRSVLIQKKPEYYRPIWPDCPDNLKMKYDWIGDL